MLSSLKGWGLVLVVMADNVIDLQQKLIDVVLLMLRRIR
jgi:hypothetical protein